MEQLPDHFFNKAVDALEKGQQRKAIEWSSAVLALRPEDEDALRMRKMLWKEVLSPGNDNHEEKSDLMS